MASTAPPEPKYDENKRCILMKLMSQISKLRRLLKKRDIVNRYETQHLELRSDLLRYMGLDVDTNKKKYLSDILTNVNLFEHNCDIYIERARVIEKAYLMATDIIKHNEAHAEDCIGKIYPGRYNDEDFYIVIDNPKSDHIYYLVNLRENHPTYGANTEDFGDGLDDPIDGKRVLSFRHA